MGPAGYDPPTLPGAIAIARARLSIDLDAIVANWRTLDAQTAPGVETAAVVKADAYGLGAAAVAPALQRAGVRSFFVALSEEGVALRDALGPGPDIYVFSGLMTGDADAVREAMLVPCLNSLEQVEAFLHALPGHPAALQIDSGMNRLGLEPNDLAQLGARAIEALAPRLVISHLACADTPGHPMNAAQGAAFRAAAALVPGARQSLAATGGLLLGEAYHFDLVRPGIGLYGGLPFAGAQPPVTLSLPVIQVREVGRDEAVGYGAAWVADRPTRVATVAAGYADGIPRALAGTGLSLYVGRSACPIIGRISMDLITVDISDLPIVPDRLDLLNDIQTPDVVAAAVETIGYEILTSLGPRYERVYKGAA